MKEATHCDPPIEVAQLTGPCAVRVRPLLGRSKEKWPRSGSVGLCSPGARGGVRAADATCSLFRVSVLLGEAL